MSNFLLHKHRKEDESFKRPEGLTELLSDISREVLRAQPECIFTFVADYLEAMLVTREQSLIAQRAFTTIVDVSMTVSDMMRHVGISREQAEASVNILECEFKRAMSNEERNELSISEETARITEGSILEKLRSKLGFGMAELHKTQRIIQVCFKDFFFREKEFELKLNRLPYDHWANQVEKTLEIYRNTGPARWELERAATAIQAGYRGYYSRKQGKYMAKLNKQATIIQSNFRGYLGRKLVQNMLNERRESSGEVTPMIGPKQSLRSIFSESEKNVEYDEQQIKAATAIQASYRGYLVRKYLKENGYEPEEFDRLFPPKDYSEKEIPIEGHRTKYSSVEHAAATKIQSAYRGHLVRRSRPDSSQEEEGEEEIARTSIKYKDELVEEEEQAVPLATVDELVEEEEQAEPIATVNELVEEEEEAVPPATVDELVEEEEQAEPPATVDALVEEEEQAEPLATVNELVEEEEEEVPPATVDELVEEEEQVEPIATVDELVEEEMVVIN